MKIVIVEDETLAVERLRQILPVCEPNAEILAEFDTIADTVDYFKQKPSAVDLLILDIELADGKSFEIFERVTIDAPVIFTTAFDSFALQAFKYYSIDYLLKPIQKEDLKTAFDKLRRVIPGRVGMDVSELTALRRFIEKATSNYRERFVIKTGNKLQFRSEEDVAIFYADGKNVFLIAKSDNRKFLVDHTLEELERCLDPTKFFRISRKYIVRVDSIQEVKGLISGKLEVKLKQSCDQELLVSRDRVSDFKSWLNS
jgi:DNA-binding LytR/AlgR family response regulator